MESQNIDNQLVRLKWYQKSNRLKTDEIANKLGISTNLLYKLYNNERNLQNDVSLKIDLLLSEENNNVGKSTYQHGDEESKNTVGEEENTYLVDTIKIRDLTGESTESFLLLKKYEYLKEMASLWKSGALTDEEFKAIKKKLINSLE